MKTERNLLAILLILVVTPIQGAYGIQISVSSGDSGESGSVTTKVETADDAAVNSKTVVSGASITPMMSISGPVSLFEETHEVKDSTGKKAQVYVKVVNAPNGLYYESVVLPKEGKVSAQSSISAEQWLTVPKADSIKCTASASYKALSASVGLTETKGSQAGDYVTLNGYYGRAYSSTKQVTASQTATDGSAYSIKINGRSNAGSGPYSVDTQLSGIAGGKAVLQGLNSKSSAGTTTQVTQKEHIHGGFTSTASYKPTSGTAKSKTRTSNYGTEYDLSMKAAKGKSPSGAVGYYVDPGMATASLGAIQGAVNAAKSGDTINLYSGTYKENVQIDKSLAINGAGMFGTFIDGHQSGSVFIIGKNDPSVKVSLSAMDIYGGSGTYLKTASGKSMPYGGGILNYGKLTVTDTRIAWNNAGTATEGGFGGGICSLGTSTIIDSDISRNSAKYGGGIYNSGILNIQETSSITWNSAYCGGGIYNDGTVTVTDSAISANSCPVNIISSDPFGNPTAYPGSGGGIYNADILTVKGSTISRNNAIGDGGGIYNAGATTIKGNTKISENSAKGDSRVYGRGGGIFNGGYYSGGTFIPGTLTVKEASTISHNSAEWGGGICNTGTTTIIGSTVSENNASDVGGGIFNRGEYSGSTFIPGTLKVVDSTISGNRAYNSGGGILNAGKLSIGGKSQIINNQATNGYGGGIYSSTKSVTFDGTRVSVKSNKAHLPSPSELKWYKGWGIYSTAGAPTITNGFNPAKQVAGNTVV